MRISDWSSDVCSSDLRHRRASQELTSRWPGGTGCPATRRGSGPPATRRPFGVKAKPLDPGPWSNRHDRADDMGNFKIGELAAAAGVGRDTIRYYERMGLLREPARTAAGYRLYDATDLERSDEPTTEL